MDSDDDELFLDIDENNYERNKDDEIKSENDGSDEQNDIDRQDKEYCEFAKTDSIRRFQFDYDESVSLSSPCPAAHVDVIALTK